MDVRVSPSCGYESTQVAGDARRCFPMDKYAWPLADICLQIIRMMESDWHAN